MVKVFIFLEIGYMFGHQDDIYEPKYTEQMLEFVNKSSDPIIYFSGYGELRNGEKVYNNSILRVKKLMLSPLKIKAFWTSKFVRRRILSLGNCICCPAVTYVKESHLKKGGKLKGSAIDKSLKYAKEFYNDSFSNWLKSEDKKKKGFNKGKTDYLMAFRVQMYGCFLLNDCEAGTFWGKTSDFFTSDNWEEIYALANISITPRSMRLLGDPDKQKRTESLSVCCNFVSPIKEQA